MSEEFVFAFLRPEEDPDFWKLSKLITDLTDRIEDGEDPQNVMMGELVEYVNDYTISYMAVQRAMRYVLETGTAGELEEKGEEVDSHAGAWLEGFLMGVRFTTEEDEDEDDDQQPG